VSEQIADRLASNCGIEGSKVLHIPHGVKGIEFEGELEKQIEEPSRPPLRLIFVGRLEQPQKRIFDLVAVVKRLVRLGVNFRLDIVGDGPESGEVKRMLSDETRKSIVAFHGWLPNGEVALKLRRADVFVLTSAYEGLPVALLEAMANAVVPLVTDIESGHRQLVTHGVNGFLAPVGDAGGFAELVEKLSRNESLLKRMKVGTWEASRQFSVEKMASSYANLFERLVAAAASDETGRPVQNYPLMPSCRSRYPLWLRRMKTAVQKAVRE